MKDINSCLGFQPKTPQRSEVYVTGGSGRGSTNTGVRVFTTLQLKQGNAITYTSSAVDGDSFKINEAGGYSISWSDGGNSGGASTNYVWGITRNAKNSVGDVNNLVYPEVVYHTASLGGPGGEQGYVQVNTTLWLEAGDIIRPGVQTSGLSSGATTVTFRITKISD